MSNVFEENTMNFCWVTINVANMERSLGFYQNLFGLKVQRKMTPGPGMELAFLGDGAGTEVELIQDLRTPEPTHGKDISLGFEVADLDAFVATLAKAGLALHSGPFQPNPKIRFAFVLDPDGVKVQLVQKL